ncbi:hypothetical protein DFH09DRAFT_1107543, partial [Mycena vulgaris]
VRRVDEEVAPDGATEEGENSDTDSAVENVRVCAPLDDLDEETLTPVLHASEMSLPAPAPHAQVDDQEALDKDAGEGADAVVDSDVEDVSIRAPLDDLDDDIPPIPQAEVPKGDEETSDGDAEEGGDADADFESDVIDDGNNDGDAEEGGEAAADSSVEDVLVSVPLDNLDEETPTPTTRGAETQVPVPPPQAQADEPEVADGDAEKGRGPDVVVDPDSNLEDVRLRAPLDDIDNESPPIPQAQASQGDEEEALDGDAEEGSVADADSASDVTEDGEAEKGGDPDADSRVEDVRVLTPLNDLDDTIPPILHVQPQPQVIEEAPDGHAVDGGDADADADSGVEDMHVRAPLEDFDEDVATPAPHAQVPQVEDAEQWIGHTTNVPSPSTLPVGVTGTSDASNTLTTPPPVLVPATSDRQLDFPRSLFTAQAMPTSLIASSFSRAAAAPASPSSISPTNASPSSSASTLPQTPPPNLGNIRQAASAPARRAPSPVRQSPSSPTPSRTYPSLGGGSQDGPSRDLRTGNKCYLLAPSTQLRRKEGRSLLRAGHAAQSGTTPLTRHVPGVVTGGRRRIPEGTGANAKILNKENSAHFAPNPASNPWSSLSLRNNSIRAAVGVTHIQSQPLFSTTYVAIKTYWKTAQKALDILITVTVMRGQKAKKRRRARQNILDRTPTKNTSLREEMENVDVCVPTIPATEAWMFGSISVGYLCGQMGQRASTHHGPRDLRMARTRTAAQKHSQRTRCSFKHPAKHGKRETRRTEHYEATTQKRFGTYTAREKRRHANNKKVGKEMRKYEDTIACASKETSSKAVTTRTFPGANARGEKSVKANGSVGHVSVSDVDPTVLSVCRKESRTLPRVVVDAGSALKTPNIHTRSHMRDGSERRAQCAEKGDGSMQTRILAERIKLDLSRRGVQKRIVSMSRVNRQDRKIIAGKRLCGPVLVK